MAETDAAAGAGAGPRVLVYPSATLRPVPAFLVAAPSGWVVDEAPDSLAVMRTAEQVDGFWVNATVSHDRVARSVDLAVAAKATWARVLHSSPSAKAGLERVARFGSNIVYMRGVELDAPESGRKLAQLQALFFAPPVPDAKTSDFFQVICTSPVDAMPGFGPVFVAMISSFEFV